MAVLLPSSCLGGGGSGVEDVAAATPLLSWRKQQRLAAAKENKLCLIPTPNISLIPPGFDESHLAHSTYKQQRYFAGAMQTQKEDKMRTLSGIEHTDGMYQFKSNNPIQEYKNKMPFEFKWNQGKACQVNPSKYGMHRRPIAC